MDTLFQISNLLALIGWMVLLVGPFVPRPVYWTAAMVLPAILAAIYTGLALRYVSGAEGGFDTLENVVLLFTQREVVLIGWVHYLAFDLFIGGWEVRVAQREGIRHIWVIPCLVFTFMLGPIGLLIFLIMRAWRKRVNAAAAREAGAG